MSKRKLPNEWNEPSCDSYCDDSVEKNEKDFAKLKDDLVGEEYNTDPVPKGTNQPNYDSDNSGSGRVSPPPSQFNNPDNFLGYGSDDDSDVDSNQLPPSIQHFAEDFGYQGRITYTIPKEEDDKNLAKLKDYLTKGASLTDREIFQVWRTVYQISYISKEEEDARFRIFQKAIVDKPLTPKHLYYNLDNYADRTKLEFQELFPTVPKPRIFKSDLQIWLWVAERNYTKYESVSTDED